MRPRIGVCLVGVALAGVLTVPSGAAVASTGDHPGDSLVVGTDKGAVQGFRAGEVDSFLGIRYAAPPTGALRWRAPQPAQPWPGVVPATAYGNRCPQVAGSHGPRTESEDCLFINVQRPTGLARDHPRHV